MPELDARTKACMQQLPWWSELTEESAVSELLTQTGAKSGSGGGGGLKGSTASRSTPVVRPKIPLPLPHFTAAHFGKVLKPSLHKCPKLDDAT
jgi:hypothetical protein